MTVYKATVKSFFYVDAESMAEAKEIVDKAVTNLPNAECNIKATKMMTADFGNRKGLA